MKNDFDLIVHSLPRDIKSVNIYPIGDVHFGSSEFSKKRWDLWKSIVKNDENGYIVIIGDMIDNGLKNSKSNSYEQAMTPRQQKEMLERELSDMSDKILGVCRGNHEYRSVLLTDECPLYDVCARMRIEDLYRENMAFIKISLGEKTKSRQFAYTLVLAHGNSRNKTNNFSYSIDGMDILVTGHTHQSESNFPSKIVIDSKNNVVSEKTFVRIVVPSFLDTGGYGLKGMYSPQGFKIPVITLQGNKKDISISWI